MRTCKNCKRKFPDYLITQMFTSDGVFTMCPICALKKRNAMHGLPEDTPFHGEMANWMWEEAQKYLEVNHETQD